jgi:hypothetical protein
MRRCTVGLLAIEAFAEAYWELHRQPVGVDA